MVVGRQRRRSAASAGRRQNLAAVNAPHFGGGLRCEARSGDIADHFDPQGAAGYRLAAYHMRFIPLLMEPMLPSAHADRCRYFGVETADLLVST